MKHEIKPQSEKPLELDPVSIIFLSPEDILVECPQFQAHVSRMSQHDLDEIARKVRNSLLDEMYWISLKEVATAHFAQASPREDADML